MVRGVVVLLVSLVIAAVGYHYGGLDVISCAGGAAALLGAAWALTGMYDMLTGH